MTAKQFEEIMLSKSMIEVKRDQHHIEMIYSLGGKKFRACSDGLDYTKPEHVEKVDGEWQSFRSYDTMADQLIVLLNQEDAEWIVEFLQAMKGRS